jgi:chaperone modulatory protein CbpM
MELVDQLHGMRGAMRKLVVAINRQEAEIQQRLLDALDDSGR